jgi:hypothetical protein
MNNKTIIFLTVLLAIALFARENNAQSSKFSAGVEGSYLSPIGTLADRWKATPGGSIYFGVQTSNKWTWGGKIEYFKYSDQNTDKLFISSTQTVNSKSYTYTVPVTGLSQRLEIFGLAADAKYNIIRNKIIEANVDVEFGIYNWTYKRNGHDSLNFNATINDTVYRFTAFSNMVANSQTDWSGGFSIGLEAVVKVFDPVEITLAGSYKNIVGELWPAMIYNMQNVSTFQMYDCKAGIRIIF